ncbi:MAG: hypothetical protein HC921_14310 [Synechococcaceae cyanobacterium SM2_3_1]|nr:hypothetical protein [Synechococcaceae cyanobacterium SM2_3_1]
MTTIEAQAQPGNLLPEASLVSGSLSELQDGTYQLCSQPDPQDWRDGAGVCLAMRKQGSQVQGYYGYPHSDCLICLLGYVQDNTITGVAASPVVMGSTYLGSPEAEFYWDEEENLWLNGRDSQLLSDPETGYSWMVLPHASLDTRDLILYDSQRMRSPDELCPWALITQAQD